MEERFDVLDEIDAVTQCCTSWSLLIRANGQQESILERDPGGGGARNREAIFDFYCPQYKQRIRAKSKSELIEKLKVVCRASLTVVCALLFFLLGAVGHHCVRSDKPPFHLPEASCIEVPLDFPD